MYLSTKKGTIRRILATAAFAGISFVAPAQIITTLIGVGHNGKTGSAGDSSFAVDAFVTTPRAIITDRAGNIYFSDYGNNRVRMVNIYGVVVTIAGTGSSGGMTGDGGPAVNARLSGPCGLAFDGTGNLYIADSKNNRIRKIDTAGIISTFAGSGVDGYDFDDTAATVARLNLPSGVAVDASGNVYVADTKNNRVRKVDVNGIISTVAGNGEDAYLGNGGAATAASLNNPSDVAVLSDGSVVIADTRNHTLRKITTDGNIELLAGNGTPGYGGDLGVPGSSKLNSPVAMAIGKDDDIYFSDENNQRVRRLSKDGKLITVAGNGSPGALGDGGNALDAQLYFPTGVGVDTTGNIYIGESKGRMRFVFMGTGAPTDVAKIFPNPCQKHTNVYLPCEFEEMATVFVYDASGRQINEIQAPTNKHINVYFDAAGCYVIYAVSKHGTWYGRAIGVQ